MILPAKYLKQTCIVMLAVVTAGLSVLLTVNAGEKKTMPNYYFLSVESHNALIEVGLNDAPLIIDVEGEGVATSEPVMSWIMPGENALTIKLKPLFEDDKPLPAKLKVKLFLHDAEQEVPTVKQLLAEYQYPELDTPEQPELPLTRAIPFEFKAPLPTKLWQQAEVLNGVTVNDKTAIIALANELFSAINAKDLDKAIQLQHYKIADDALAEDKTVDRLIKATRTNYEWVTSQPGLTGTALAEENSRFQICCDNKLVYLSRRDGQSAVAMETDEMFFDIDIFAARIGRQWLIAR